MILCGTGHRPNKLGGYEYEASLKLYNFACKQLEKLQPELVISGMALGWDTAIAQAATECGIPFHAYIPFVGQESRWPAQSQSTWAGLMEQAAEVVVCSPGPYGAWKMQVRNKAMVDASDLVLALWDGSDGGTANCVRYANQRGKEVLNVWDEYKQQST